jgi:hypothetical protein
MISKNDQAVACLTIRQYYAAKAIQGLTVNFHKSPVDYLGAVEMAFKIADAMIEFENKEDK